MKKKNTTINSKHVRSQCIEKALLMIKMLAMAYSDSHLYPVFQATYKVQAYTLHIPCIHPAHSTLTATAESEGAFSRDDQ